MCSQPIVGILCFTDHATTWISGTGKWGTPGPWRCSRRHRRQNPAEPGTQGLVVALAGGERATKGASTSPHVILPRSLWKAWVKVVRKPGLRKRAFPTKTILPTPVSASPLNLTSQSRSSHPFPQKVGHPEGEDRLFYYRYKKLYIFTLLLLAHIFMKR